METPHTLGNVTTYRRFWHFKEILHLKVCFEHFSPCRLDMWLWPVCRGGQMSLVTQPRRQIEMLYFYLTLRVNHRNIMPAGGSKGGGMGGWTTVKPVTTVRDGVWTFVSMNPPDIFNTTIRTEPSQTKHKDTSGWHGVCGMLQILNLVIGSCLNMTTRTPLLIFTSACIYIHKGWCFGHFHPFYSQR